MMTIFIDTGAFLSRHLENDQFHDISVNFWKEIENQEYAYFTSNFIINETLTLLGRRAGNKFAVKVADHLYNSNVMEILRPDDVDEMEAVKLMGKYAEHHVGFTDCLSGVLMKKHHISNIFTFDEHFHLWKFKVLPWPP